MIITVKPNGIKVLTPEAGYPAVTNGEIYSDRVVLGISASENDWREASQAEYDEYLAHGSDEDEISAEEAMSIITGGATDEA